MGKHLLVFRHVKSNFNSLIFYFAFLLDLQCIDSSRNACPSGPSYEHEHCWWKLYRRSQYFCFYFKLKCFEYCTCMISQNKWQFFLSITKTVLSIIQKSMSFQRYFIFVQQVGQYNFGISFSLMQFGHYFMCLLIVESLVARSILIS